MNLRSVHAFVILMSAALAAVFGIWCLSRYSQEGGIVSLVAAIVAFAVSAGLVTYDSWFLRRTKKLR